MATADLYRLAGPSTWVSLVALLLSAIALALFFAGAGEFWGPVNDALIVVTAIALIPAVLAVARLVGDGASVWVPLLTVATVGGLALMAVGQTLLIIGRLSLDGSYVTGGLGIVPVIAWIVLVVILSLGSDVLPRQVGWLAAATLVSIVAVSIVAAITRGPVLWVGSVAMVALFAAWLASLASAFAAASASAAAAAV